MNAPSVLGPNAPTTIAGIVTGLVLLLLLALLVLGALLAACASFWRKR